MTHVHEVNFVDSFIHSKVQYAMFVVAYITLKGQFGIS